MEKKISYSNLIEKMKEEFPEYSGNPDDEQHKMVYFTFFMLYVLDNFSNNELLSKAAELINKMAVSGDIDLDGILDDAFLTLYSGCRERGLSVELLVSKFSERAKTFYGESVTAWKKGNKIE